MRITTTVTAKGQITIPRIIRDRFQGKVVEFVVTDDHIELRGVPSVAGSLASFAESFTPIEIVREKTWENKSNADEN